MSRLLKLTALIEAATGLGLIVMPSLVVRLLLGSPLDASAVAMGVCNPDRSPVGVNR